MIIVRLKGGMGNQLFQYALGRNLAMKNNTGLEFDVKELKQDKLRKYELDNFYISGRVCDELKLKFQIKIRSTIFSKLLGQQFIHIKQMGRSFDESVLERRGNVYLDGYWQCEKYFRKIRNVILKETEPKRGLDKNNRLMLEKIKETDSVCMHIRRGDFVSDEKTNRFHGLCSLQYYYNAADLIERSVKNPNFFVFSDDCRWIKSNLKLKYQTTLVDINGPEKGYADLHLMRNGKHFIIANSAFSWWGAWLSENADKIVCVPKKWFSAGDSGDIIPESWIKMEG